jgi:hypothetical protein
MRRWAILLVFLLAAGCSEERAPRAAAPAPITSEEHRFTGSLPAGWTLAQEPQTPSLVNPVEILSAGTMAGPRPRSGRCAHVPVGALESMGPRDAFVTVQERLGQSQFPARPAHFALPPETPGTDAAFCSRNGNRLEIHWFEFSDARRGFHVLVALGRGAAPERREEALALLDSLRFEPGPAGVHIDGDVAQRFSAGGLSWLMPVPPWRWYDWPLTSTQEERLAVGTFELERTAPDRNCTPRAAIAALPDDGAFIYVFENHAATQGSAPVTLGPEVDYECLGRSRMARRRVGDHTLQAHVYFGPSASARVKEEARSILNSIQVEVE